MSLDVAKGGFYDYQSQQAPALNVPLLLVLGEALVGLLLVCHHSTRMQRIAPILNDEANHSQAVYSHGCVFAVLTATLRPSPEAQSSLSKQHSRGLPIYIFHRLVKIFLISRFSMRGSDLPRCMLLNITVELLLSNLKAANVRAILTQSSELPYYRRILSWSEWSKTFPAMLLYSIASSLCFYLPVYYIQLAGLGRELEVSENMQLVCVLAIILILYFGAVIPTYAIFLRVAAATQGNGSIDIKSAWQSFPRSARVHFFRLLAEVLVMETCVSIIIFVFVLAHFHPELHDDVMQFFVKYFG